MSYYCFTETSFVKKKEYVLILLSNLCLNIVLNYQFCLILNHKIFKLCKYFLTADGLAFDTFA